MTGEEISLSDGPPIPSAPRAEGRSGILDKRARRTTDERSPGPRQVDVVVVDCAHFILTSQEAAAGSASTRETNFPAGKSAKTEANGGKT